MKHSKVIIAHWPQSQVMMGCSESVEVDYHKEGYSLSYICKREHCSCLSELKRPDGTEIYPMEGGEV